MSFLKNLFSKNEEIQAMSETITIPANIQEAPLFKLKPKDIGKGLFTAVLSAVSGGALELVWKAISSGTFDFSIVSPSHLAMYALAGGLGYIQKNLLTNSQDKILTKEPKQVEAAGK